MTVETVQVPRTNPRLPGPEDMVARRVAWERKRRGWSTAELARRMTEAGVPVNQSSVYKIESGEPRRTISLDEAHALVRVFGLRDLHELESIPGEVISRELAGYLVHLATIDHQAHELEGRILATLQGAGRAAADLEPVIDYLQADPLWTRVGEIEERLTELAGLITEVRDAVHKLRLSGESGGQQ